MKLDTAIWLFEKGMIVVIVVVISCVLFAAIVAPIHIAMTSEIDNDDYKWIAETGKIDARVARDAEAALADDGIIDESELERIQQDRRDREAAKEQAKYKEIIKTDGESYTSSASSATD